MRAMTSSTRQAPAEAPAPSPAELLVLESCADRAAALGGVLAGSRELRLDGCAPLDLTSATTLEFLLLGIRVATKQHLQRGDDLLRLIERAGAILDAGRGARADGGKTDAGLHLVRGIAMAELVQDESRTRFPRHAGLGERADAAMASLVAGFLARFGGELPGEVRRAFPRFAAAMREAWRPIQARRGLLLWLTQRG
jgi:hypothetical protein